MNQKGITLVELLVSFSIITILSLGLFKATLNIEEKQMINISKNNFVSFNSIINNSIQNDFLTKEINSFTQCGTNCYEIKYKGNEIKKLELNKDKKIISYGDVKEKLPNNYFFYDDIKLTEYTSTDNESNSYILLNIPIRSNFDSNKKDIKIMYQYNGTDILKINIKSYIENLYNTAASENGLVKDDTDDENIRYAGSDEDVKNYVSFDGDVWRIIGIVDGKVKLVKEKSIGDYSWDSSASDMNNGYGYNIWETIEGKTKGDGTTKADLNILLNDGFYGGAYPSECYGGQNNAIKDCPAEYINSTLKNMVDENAIWYLGGQGYSNPSTAPYGLPTLDSYNNERGTKVYSGHTNIAKTEWIGPVGLIYPSDYGYASTDSECRSDLRAGVTYIDGTFDYSNAKCKNNNWLYKNNYYWTISPYSGSSNSVFYVDSSGFAHVNNEYYAFGVWPALYLKSNILIESGDGSSSNPYILKAS